MLQRTYISLLCIVEKERGVGEGNIAEGRKSLEYLKESIFQDGEGRIECIITNAII